MTTYDEKLTILRMRQSFRCPSDLCLQVAIMSGHFELGEIIKNHKDSDIGNHTVSLISAPTSSSSNSTLNLYLSPSVLQCSFWNRQSMFPGEKRAATLFLFPHNIHTHFCALIAKTPCPRLTLPLCPTRLQPTPTPDRYQGFGPTSALSYRIGLRALA